jgi:hypothetical protein
MGLLTRLLFPFALKSNEDSFGRKRLFYTPTGGETKYYYDDLDMSIKVGDMVELNDLGRQYDHLVEAFPNPARVTGILENTGKYSGNRHITVNNPDLFIHTFYNNVIKKYVP